MLLTEFQLPFKVFEVEKVSHNLFHAPFSMALGDSELMVLLKLIDLLALKTMHQESSLLDFYKNLDKSKCGNVMEDTLKVVSHFRSTFVCGQTFFLMTLNNNRFQLT